MGWWRRTHAVRSACCPTAPTGTVAAPACRSAHRRAQVQAVDCGLSNTRQHPRGVAQEGVGGPRGCMGRAGETCRGRAPAGGDTAEASHVRGRLPSPWLPSTRHPSLTSAWSAGACCLRAGGASCGHARGACAVHGRLTRLPCATSAWSAGGCCLRSCARWAVMRAAFGLLPRGRRRLPSASLRSTRLARLPLHDFRVVGRCVLPAGQH